MGATVRSSGMRGKATPRRDSLLGPARRAWAMEFTAACAGRRQTSGWWLESTTTHGNGELQNRGDKMRLWRCGCSGTPPSEQRLESAAARVLSIFGPGKPGRVQGAVLHLHTASYRSRDEEGQRAAHASSPLGRNLIWHGDGTDTDDSH